MRRPHRLITTLLVVCLLAVPAAAKKKKKKGEEAAPARPAVTVERWLRLGPLLEALPVFHDADEGGVGLKDLLDGGGLPATSVPREGDAVPWFGERPVWQPASADSGLVALDPPEGSSEARPAVAYLAAFVHNTRFREVTVELLGLHPRRAWLNGEALASGMSGEVEKKTALRTGRHLLVVQTLRDPDNEDPWQAGARLSALADDDDLGGLRAGRERARGVDIEDVLDAPRVDFVAASPAGELIAAGLSRGLPGSSDRESWIEVRHASDGAVVRSWRGLDGLGRVAWAPSGKRLTYTSRHGSGDGATTTIWIADLVGGEARALTGRIEKFTGYRWSPDGRTIVYSTSVDPPKDETGIKRVRGLQDRWRNFRTKRYLHLLDVESGVSRRLTAGGLTTGVADISPDGRRLLFTRSVEQFDARPFSRTELWEIDLRTSAAKKLFDRPWLNGAQYSPDGARLLLRGSAELFDEGVNLPDGGATPNGYDNQLFIYDPADASVDPITFEFDPAVGGATWAADGDIYLTAQDREYVRLYRYRADGRVFETVATGFDTFGGVSVSENAATAVGTGSSPWRAPGMSIIDLQGERGPLTVEPAGEYFADLTPGEVERWDFVTDAGEPIEGRTYLPPGFDPGRKYPLIVYYYGGTSPTNRSFGGRYPKEYWASQGYVVYVLQPSGATGFGQAFSARHVNNWGKTTANEIIEGTRKFLAAHPFVDRERVGCIGASYGGFMTMLLSTKTDLFAACVSHAGISALSSYWGEGYWGALYSSIATADSYPWNRRDLYVDQSPLFRADRNRVPILLTHGAADTNVPVGESDQFFVALKLLGKQVEYLQVAGQDHWIVDHDKRLLWSRSIVAWFDRWLKGEPDWWEHLYPDGAED